MKNVVKVRIYGKEYALTTEETETYTHKLASVLNQKLDKIPKGSSLNKLDAAVLVALECLDEALKATTTVENIRTQIKNYADEASTAKAKLDEVLKENRMLTGRVSQLEKEVEVRKALGSGDK